MTTRMTRFAATASIALLCLAAAGCDGGRDTAAGGEAGTDAAESGSFIGRQVARGIAEAQRELETKNIGLGSGSQVFIDGRSFGTGRAADGLPKAEITPQGALLIAGEEVETTAEQRELLLDHRRHLVGLAQAGMAVGAKGADVAGTALSGLGQAVFGGEEGRKAYEARIEAEAEKIKAEAVRLCALLPALHDSQQALAASLPAFAPYATMTPEDVSDCGKDHEADAGTTTAAHAPG